MISKKIPEFRLYTGGHGQSNYIGDDSDFVYFKLTDIDKYIKEDILQLPDSELQLYTKVDDKNGKKIYDGDLIRFMNFNEIYGRESPWKQRGLVERGTYFDAEYLMAPIRTWVARWSAPAGNDITRPLDEIKDARYKFKDLEVIGNKFNDSQLLKEIL